MIDKRTAATIAMVAFSVLDAVTWMTKAPGFAFVGLLMGAALTLRTCRVGFDGSSIALYCVLASAGFLAAGGEMAQHGAALLGVQVLWNIGFFVAALIHRVAPVAGGRGAGGSAAPSPRAQRKAEKERIAANRKRDLEYAEQVEREQNFQTHATRPGTLTGYEPAALAAVDLAAASSSAAMHGSPGIGLAGAGFDAAAVERGAEGEVNFAKALVKAGLLGRFATFWSVQMPDEEIGASAQFLTDIDCVVVTGATVWLLDMKNYNQGDVTWKVEAGTDVANAAQLFLVAADNVTGGQVGQKRKMSLNMKLATERFATRFARSGVDYKIQRAVVLMPRPDGLGVIPNGMMWAGGIPTVGLPTALDWLAREKPFNPGHQDAQILMAILKPLIKDESGSAHRLGEIKAPPPGAARRSSAPATSTVPPAPGRTAAPGGRTAAVVAAPAPAPPTAPGCPSCGDAIQDDWTICEHCGEAL